MTSVFCFFKSIDVNLEIGPDIRDITPELNTLVTKSGIINGSLAATIIGSTGSITTIEFEPGVVEDLKRAINNIAPQGDEYEHEKAWHDGNGHSHVQAAICGPSISIPIRNNTLRLGTWQQIVAINHDNRSRSRTIEVTMYGNQ